MMNDDETLAREAIENATYDSWGAEDLREVGEAMLRLISDNERLRRERDTFETRLNRLDTELELEQALRSYYATLKANIEEDGQHARLYAEATSLRTGEQKRYHQRVKERQQIDWHKRDALRKVAHMAGLDLANGVPQREGGKRAG